MKTRLIAVLMLLLCISLTGCADKPEAKEKTGAAEEQNVQDKQEESAEETADEPEPSAVGPEILIEDYSQYFNGINGCAVFYNPEQNMQILYNEALTDVRKPPCSTFKIISTLAGLQYGAVEDEHTTFPYNGKQYRIEAWNKENSLAEAFDASCVWYYRQLIDETGKEAIDNVLQELEYGNCDASEWEGVICENSPELQGFWIDSSLQISALEQVRVLADIMEGNTSFDPQHIALLKTFMQTETDAGIIYGKTGTSGVENLAWYVGFTESEEGNWYFAIRLDDTDSDSITGAKAREITADIIKNW